jgi:redox-sensitive bicupin YhaK (pirin superfamily)
MIRIRPGHTRGRFSNDWLDARFSFSFGSYHDPAYDGYSDLMVLNDDRVAPGGGFAPHPHVDVEVMSYPISGTIEHRDSLGNVALMRPGDVHLMRAGTGIRHSEMNASASEPEHHLQWWIRPAATGLQPGYQRRHLSVADKRNRWAVLAAPDRAPRTDRTDQTDGALSIAQDVRIFAALIDGAVLRHEPAPGRRAYLHVVAGEAVVGGQALGAGDAAFFEGEPVVVAPLRPGAAAEVLLFDLR